VEVRLSLIQPRQAEQAIRKSTLLQERLWAQTVKAVKQSFDSNAAGLLVQSVNEVIAVHARRVNLGLRTRVPTTIWVALYLVSILSMGAVGYHTGVVGKWRSLATLPLVLAFSAVMLLIADLDRPQEGLLRVSQQAMIDLRDSFRPLP
jgi:hypothetical protein